MTSTELRTIRTDAGLSQHQLALLLGVTQDAVAHWESGRRGISTITQIAIHTVTKEKTMTVEKIKELSALSESYGDLGVSIHVLEDGRVFNIEAEPPMEIANEDDLQSLVSDIEYWLVSGNENPEDFEDEIAEMCDCTRFHLTK